MKELVVIYVPPRKKDEPVVNEVTRRRLALDWLK